jgi:glyoxylase-like metal-dependent hydrolase (beta-lactamase superfamily II)/rhodanese-related sulfurtransferase
VIFRQLFDASSNTYSYLLADEHSREAVLIDPVFEQHARDAALIRELGLRLLFTVDTHCHADHVTGAWLMKKRLGSRIALAEAYGAKNVDVPLKAKDTLRFGQHALEVRATPGHTVGCLSLVTEDHRMVFTGDSLLIRSAGRTDFQGGDAKHLYRSIQEQLFTLPDECALYPGHDYQGRTSSTIGEERQYNARIGGGAREQDFVGYMNNLALPHPKQMAAAVPANQRSGEPEDGQVPASPAWGPLVVTYGGTPEIAADWVASHRSEVHVLDVRSPAEFSGELGHLKGAQLIPIDELRAKVGEVQKDKPVVTICNTGKRSALAAAILSGAGISKVASITGGMVEWRHSGLPS